MEVCVPATAQPVWSFAAARLAALFVVLCSGDCEGSAEPTNSSALLQTPQMVLTALQEICVSMFGVVSGNVSFRWWRVCRFGWVCVCVCFSAVSGPLSKAKYVLVLTSLRAYTLLGWSPHLVTGSPLIGTLWNGHSSWPYIMERPCPFHKSLVSQSKENAPGSGHFAMAWSEMWIAGWRRLKAVGFFHRKWSQTDQFHHKKRNMN
jgi:hypothetical protein